MSDAAARPVWLIRHAESEWNAQGRWQGQRDPALSERGREQAQRLATSLAGAGIEAIVASDLRPRARDGGDRRPRDRRAAASSTRGCASATSGTGRVSPASRSPRAGRPISRACARAISSCSPGGGESLRALHARVAAFVAALARAPGDGAIALVTHAGVLRALGIAPAPGNAAARSATIGALHAALRDDGALFAATPFPQRDEEERL